MKFEIRNLELEIQDAGVGDGCFEEGLSACRRFTAEYAKGAEHICDLEFEIRDWALEAASRKKP